MEWTVYILKCADETLYTGVTNDIDKRLAMHESGKGAKYTKGRGPFLLIHTESFATKGDALRREIEIKSYPRAQKILLVKAQD